MKTRINFIGYDDTNNLIIMVSVFTDDGVHVENFILLGLPNTINGNGTIETKQLSNMSKLVDIEDITTELKKQLDEHDIQLCILVNTL